MKIIITEDRIFNAIYKYIDNILYKDEINWVYGPNEEDDDWQENPENKEFLIFHKGEWRGEDYTDIVFYYFTKDYYDDSPAASPFKNAAPILDVPNDYSEKLYNLFGRSWREPMKKWFEDKFNLPVKTINTWG